MNGSDHDDGAPQPEDASSDRGTSNDHSAFPPDGALPQEYPTSGEAPILRELTSAEWNHERLNRASSGSGLLLHSAVVETALGPRAFHQALEALVNRHELLHARIARVEARDASESAAERLAFVDGGKACYPHLTVTLLPNASATWLPYAERLLNEGPIATWEASGFGAHLLIDPANEAKKVCLLTGAAAFCDPTSLADLMHEWLRDTASAISTDGPGATAPQSPPGLRTPFVDMALAPELLAALNAFHTSFGAWQAASIPARRVDQPDLIVTALDLEERLLALASPSSCAGKTKTTLYPSALLELQPSLNELTLYTPRFSEMVSEDAPNTEFPRALQVATGISVLQLDADLSAALTAQCEARGVTLQGALGASVLHAFAARQKDLGRRDDLPQLAATRVNLRPRTQTSSSTLACISGIAHSTTRAAHDDDFWDVATVHGAAIEEQLLRGRALAGVVDQHQLDRQTPSTGTALPALSDLGPSPVHSSYGNTTTAERDDNTIIVRDVQTVVAAQGGFALEVFWRSFNGSLSACICWERPTISDESLASFAERCKSQLKSAI